MFLIVKNEISLYFPKSMTILLLIGSITTESIEAPTIDIYGDVVKSIVGSK